MEVMCVKLLQIIHVGFYKFWSWPGVSDDALHWAQMIRAEKCAALLLDMAESEETFILTIVP